MDTWSSTAGAGGSISDSRVSGSSPLAWVIGPPGVPSADRNAASVKRFCCPGSLTKARKSAAAACLRLSTHSAASTTYGLSDSSVPSFG